MRARFKKVIWFAKKYVNKEDKFKLKFMVFKFCHMDKQLKS